MTKEQAVTLAKTQFWTKLTEEEIAKFQIDEPLLCMPFQVFHNAVQKTLGRPVFTHEFGINLEGLKAEVLRGAPAPTFDEIMQMFENSLAEKV